MRAHAWYTLARTLHNWESWWWYIRGVHLFIRQGTFHRMWHDRECHLQFLKMSLTNSFQSRVSILPRRVEHFHWWLYFRFRPVFDHHWIDFPNGILHRQRWLSAINCRISHILDLRMPFSWLLNALQHVYFLKSKNAVMPTKWNTEKIPNSPNVPLIGPFPWMFNKSRRIFNEYLPVNVSFGNWTVKLNRKFGISVLK